MKVSIISLGRLGGRLYKEFSRLGHEVNGSYCSTSKGLSGEVRFNYQDELPPVELNLGDLLIFNLTPSVIKSIKLFERFLETVDYKKNYIYKFYISIWFFSGKC